MYWVTTVNISVLKSDIQVSNNKLLGQKINVLAYNIVLNLFYLSL